MSDGTETHKSSWWTEQSSRHHSPPSEPEPPTPEQEKPAATGDSRPSSPLQGTRTQQLALVAAGLLVIGLPATVGLVALLRPAAAAPPTVASNDEAEPVSASGAEADDLLRPTWTRSTVGSSGESTVFELQASNDVPFATGWLRPRLAISCSDDSVDVHVVTNGTAPIDPETSRHIVRITFDGADAQPQRWIGSNNQQALFSPDPRALIAQMGRASKLDFVYTHYMAGATTVTFNLTGADEILATIATACHWERSGS